MWGLVVTSRQTGREGLRTVDADRYWTRPPGEPLKSHSHWREADCFAGSDRWCALGQEHVRWYESSAAAFGASRQPPRIVEWGCGGGANAVAFAPLCAEYVGVDVAAASLAETARQLATVRGCRFVPVLVGVREPERVLEVLPRTFDVFLCTYVFELLPSPAYGLRILRLAHRLLAPGGIALIQIKYRKRPWWTRLRALSYSRDPANSTAYAIDEFWSHAERCGFTRQLVTLAIEQPLVGDRHYAYFALSKPE